MKKINCALIGYGNVGEQHAYFLEKNSTTNLIYIYEKKSKIRKNNKFKFKNVKWVENENIIFKDKNIDLVVISSYDNHHFRQIKKSLEYKKYIFCEKPICQNLNQLKEINNLLKKNKSNKFSSNLILRSDQEFNFIKKLINKKKIGKIYYSEGDYNYGRLNKLTQGWRGLIPFYSVMSGGGIHLIDTICDFLSDYPSSVYASANKIITKKTKFKFNDFVIAILKFKDKSLSKITANFGCVTSHHHSLKIFGSKATFLKEYDNSKLIINRDNKKRNKYQKFKFEKKNKKYKILENFIDSFDKKLKKKRELPDNLTVIKIMLICFAIEKSFKTNKEIKINYKNITLN